MLQNFIAATLLAIACCTPAFSEDLVSVRLVGTCEISGDQSDMSGLSHALTVSTAINSEHTTENFNNNLFGGISAITWSGKGDIYWMLPDRGPLDGAVDWTCRIHRVRIACNMQSSSVSIEILDTIILVDQNGNPYTGIASAFEATENRGHRFDPEGVCVGKNGNLYISDEYGPHLIEFTQEGKFVRKFNVPSRYQVEHADVSKPTENPKNETGRATNRGMEGLTINPESNQLLGLMQSSLLQDAEREERTSKPNGSHCRVPCFDLSNGDCSGEFVYRLDHQSNKLNEILFCGDQSFVVIERDGEAGSNSAFKKLMLISTDGSSDISEMKSLPAFDLPSGVKPVNKKVLIDLLDEQWGLAGDQFPEKVEGLAFGPDIDEQYRLLLVASDNDFSPDQPTMIYAFAIAKHELCPKATVKTSR